MLITSMNRWQASALHLALSLCILFAFTLAIYFIWYPDVFFNYGGAQGLKIIAAIDIILGPLLTFIIFNPRKKELKFDLFCIALLQVAALTYGGWKVYSERPVAHILSPVGLHIISASQLTEHNISKKTLASIYSKKEAAPYGFYLDLPKNQELINQIQTATALVSKTPLVLRHDLFLPYKDKLGPSDIFYLRNFQFSITNNCYTVDLHTLQNVESTACINLERGSFTVSNK